MKEDQKNLLTVFVLCLAILVGGDYLMKWLRPQTPATQESATLTTAVSEKALPKDGFDSEDDLQNERALLQNGQTPDGVTKTAAFSASEEAMPLMPEAPAIPFETKTLKGKLNTKGPLLNLLFLTQHFETAGTKNEARQPVALLQPITAAHPYEVFLRWHDLEGQSGLVPPVDALWQNGGRGDNGAFILFWQHPAGVRFERHIVLDEKGMFFITERVINQTSQALNLALRGSVRRAKPDMSSQMLVYEGPVGFINGALKELSYDDLQKKGQVVEEATTGWLGIADKYWLVAFAPEKPFVSSFAYKANASGRTAKTPYHVAFMDRGIQVPAHGVAQVKTRLYAGAKDLHVLDFYETSENILHFDKAIDFGWFYFLTKPIFYTLSWLKGLTGNFGLAILVFTVLLKLLFFPLANKSYRSMAKMKLLGPELERLKERYKDDQQRMSQELMAFYKREKVNPVSGCLPMLLQMPFFFALYKVLLISVDARHAPFFGWIVDLSAPDPTNIFTLCGLIPLELPGFLTLGLWPLIMGLSMLLQQKMSPPPADPTQRIMFTYGMPIIFTYMFSGFAAGVVIYWTWNNLLSMAQQWMIGRMAAQETLAQKKKKR